MGRHAEGAGGGCRTGALLTLPPDDSWIPGCHYCHMSCGVLYAHAGTWFTRFHAVWAMLIGAIRCFWLSLAGHVMDMHKCICLGPPLWVAVVPFLSPADCLVCPLECAHNRTWVRGCLWLFWQLNRPFCPLASVAVRPCRRGHQCLCPCWHYGGLCVCGGRYVTIARSIIINPQKKP